MRSYLIQAISFQPSPVESLEGFDKLFFCKYMGAAEFEATFYKGKLCNPLRLSLDRMTQQKDMYSFFACHEFKDFNNDSLIVYCKKEDFAEILPIIKNFSVRDYRAKRPVSLANYLKIKSQKEFEKDPYCTNLWWDIENDFFFFFGEDKEKLISDCFAERYEKYFPKKLTFFEKLRKKFAKEVAKI